MTRKTSVWAITIGLNIVLLGAVAWMINDMCHLSTHQWNIGDDVCFKLNGKPASVKWWQRAMASTGRPTSYQVVSTNDFGQVYDVWVLETSLQDCK